MMTSFAYDVIDPCDLIRFPAKYGSILLVKMYPPMTHPIYAVGVSAKRSTHTVDLANMRGGDCYL